MRMRSSSDKIGCSAMKYSFQSRDLKFDELPRKRPNFVTNFAQNFPSLNIEFALPAFAEIRTNKIRTSTEYQIKSETPKYRGFTGVSNC